MAKLMCHLQQILGRSILSFKLKLITLFFLISFIRISHRSLFSLARPLNPSSSPSPTTSAAFSLKELGNSLNDALLGLLQGSYRIDLDEDGKKGLIVHYDFHNIDYGLKGIGLTRRTLKKHKNWTGILENSRIQRFQNYVFHPLSIFREKNPNFKLHVKKESEQFEVMENLNQNHMSKNEGQKKHRRFFTTTEVNSEIHLKQTHAESWKLAMEKPYLLYRFLLCSLRLSNAEFGTMIGMEYNGHNESLRGLFSKTFRLDNLRYSKSKILEEEQIQRGTDIKNINKTREKRTKLKSTRQLHEEKNALNHKDDSKSIYEEKTKSPIDLKISLTPIFTWKRLNLSNSVPKKSGISPSFDIFSGATTCEWVEALPHGIIGPNSKSLKSSNLIYQKAQNQKDLNEQYQRENSKTIIEQEEDKESDPYWAIRESIKAKYGKANIDENHANLKMMKMRARMLGTEMSFRKTVEGVEKEELKAFDWRTNDAKVMNTRRRAALRISLFTSPFYGTSNASGCFLKLEYSQLGVIPIAPPESMCTKLSVSLPIFTSLFTDLGYSDNERKSRNDKLTENERNRDRTLFSIEHFFHVNMNSIWPLSGKDI